MKTIFRTAIIASAAVLAVACGSKSTKNDVAQVAEVAPTVSVVEVSARLVPQTAVYTSTVQPYVKNNIKKDCILLSLISGVILPRNP